MNVVKINKSLLWNMVLVYNQDKSILEQLPISDEMECKLHGRCKMYCECSRNKGQLVIGKEVMADW